MSITELRPRKLKYLITSTKLINDPIVFCHFAYFNDQEVKYL
jgi:hypothetical protein